MRKFRHLLTTLLTLAALMWGTAGWTQVQTYTKITSDTELVAGAKYLLVGYKSEDPYAMGLQNTNNRASVQITETSGSITVEPATLSDDTKPFEITLEGTTGAWNLFDAVNVAYLRPRTGKNNGLQGQATTTDANWTISIASTGEVNAVCENTTIYERNILRFNASNNPPLFACYGSGQTDVYLFKLEEGQDNDSPTPTFFPEDGAEKVFVDIHPTITFDKDIYTSAGDEVDNANVESLITFTDGTDPVVFTATIEDRVITVVPDAELEYSTEYTLTIAAVKDDADNEMDSDVSVSFTTLAATDLVLRLTSTMPEVLYEGDPYTLTWDAKNIDKVKIEAWLPSDSPEWVEIEGDFDASIGEYDGAVGPDAPFSNEYKIRISGTADGDPSVETDNFTVRKVFDNLTNLRASADGTEFRFDGEAVVSYARAANNQKYIQDADAAVIIHDQGGIITDTYTIGSAMTGLVGKISIYRQLVQVVPLENPGVPVSEGNAVVPFATTLENITSDDQSKLIKLENVRFTSTGQFASGQNYTIADDNENTAIYRTAFTESDYLGKDIPTQPIVEMLVLVGQFDADIQLTSRSINDWVILSDDVSLATFTLGGSNTLELLGLQVADPVADDGAKLYVDDFTGFEGIVVEATDAQATVEVQLNGVEVDAADLATQALVADDVVVVKVTAEDNTTVGYYKVTLSDENRVLQLTAPLGANTYASDDVITFKWDALNVEKVNLYAVDNSKAAIKLNDTPIDADLGEYEYTVPNGFAGTFKFRITDASDPTFFNETDDESDIEDNRPPTVLSTTPENNADDLAILFTLRMFFDEEIVEGSGDLTIHKADDDEVVATIAADEVTISDDMLSVEVPRLEWETEYYINIEKGFVTDIPGNDYDGIDDKTTWTFTTKVEPNTELFFSEYIEGTSNNKSIEIYNPFFEEVDLQGYKVILYSNGKTTPQATHELTGTLGAGKVYVIAHNSAAQAIKDVATVVDPSNGGVTNYNGDDALELYKGEDIIDVIGIVGVQQNFAVAGVDAATLDHTLVRKTHITIGNTNWEESAGTNAEDSEWIVHPVNTFKYLGWHGASSDADIISYSLADQTKDATIDATNRTIQVEIIKGADITQQTPVFTLSAGAKAYIGSTEQVSGTSVVDFTNPVAYRVVAEDGEAEQIWTVTATEAVALSNKAEIVTITFATQVSTPTINSEEGTVTAKVEGEIDELEPTIVVSAGATINPASGTAQDFTTPVEYTVTAQDGTTKVWTVTVEGVGVTTIYDIQFTEDASGDSPYKGQVVTTQGIVTAHHYNHQGGTFQGVFIQDGEGAWNGLYVYDIMMDPVPAVGDEIRITGLIEEYFQLTELTSDKGEIDMNIQILSQNNELPDPALITTGEAASEAWEGVLVRVEDAKYTHPIDTYKVLGVDDGSGVVYVDDDMFDHESVFVFNQVYDITGIGHFSFEQHKILPRFADDIALASSVNITWGEDIEVYPNPFTGTLWIDNVDNAKHVVVLNLLGQPLLSVDLGSSSRTAISTDTLPSGVYLINIIGSNGERAVRRMIKQ